MRPTRSQFLAHSTMSNGVQPTRTQFMVRPTRSFIAQPTSPQFLVRPTRSFMTRPTRSQFLVRPTKRFSGDFELEKHSVNSVFENENLWPILINDLKKFGETIASTEETTASPELKGEPIADKVKSPELAGILSFKISIIDPKENPIDIMKEPEWARKLPRRPKLRSIRAYIYSCKDLPAADEDGSSDPYIQVWDTADKKE